MTPAQDIVERREWLIRKDGYFYRPNCQGYTTRKIEAGRYTKAKAEAEAAVEPWHMSAVHQDEVPDEPAVADLNDTISRLTADNEALRKERDEARAKVLAAWNAFAGHVADDYDETIDVSLVVGGDLDEQIRSLTEQRDTDEARADALAQKVERLRTALEAIRDFPKPGTSRRTEDGYPDEIVYDEFAYRRIVDSYREAARAALGDRP
jgi:hypothetical protein